MFVQITQTFTHQVYGLFIVDKVWMFLCIFIYETPLAVDNFCTGLCEIIIVSG